MGKRKEFQEEPYNIFEVSGSNEEQRPPLVGNVAVKVAVSYTHLTLPTNREV